MLRVDVCYVCAVAAAVRMRWALTACISGVVLSLIPIFGVAGTTVTVDDLVRRVHIPLAAISPDGRFAAYLLAEGDPLQDTYVLTLRIADTHSRSLPLTIQRYSLSPEETFSEFGWFQLNAASLYWVSDDDLAFTAKINEKMQLFVWSGKQGRARALSDPHDWISIDEGGAGDELSFHTTDVVDAVKEVKDRASDSALVMTDDRRFVDPFRNPITGRWLRRQKWIMKGRPIGEAHPEGRPIVGSEWSPEFQAEPLDASLIVTRKTDDTVSYLLDATQSPDGQRVALQEVRNAALLSPGESYTTSRIVLKHSDGDHERPLTPFEQPRLMQPILGWAKDGHRLYYLSIGAEKSSVNVVTIRGRNSVVWQEPAGLQKPGASYLRHCQVLSKNGRFALLTRSTAEMPDELIKIDLEKSLITSIEAPNENFKRKVAPEVQFRMIGDTPDAWGHLYLPIGYESGRRYPLVITQYMSTAGFAIDTGDEIPILPLTASGIAVFAMHSRELNHISSNGDFRMEISRVQRPLDGMEWIIRQLDSEGVVDDERVGLAGLSYGAEIAIYALWKSRAFRAVSAATGSWEPTHYLLSGPAFESFLTQRGFPVPNDAGLAKWHSLSLGLNARADLPPLLLQSAESERMATAPTWTALRRASAAVDWYEYPNEGHVKQHPAHKWRILNRNLDWFRFWLNQDEDHASAEDEVQYQRWRELRSMGSPRPDTVQ